MAGGRVTRSPCASKAGVAILTKRGVPDGGDLEETLEGLAGVRARLRGEGSTLGDVGRMGPRTSAVVPRWFHPERISGDLRTPQTAK